MPISNPHENEDLEAELVRLQDQNDALAAEAEHEDMLVRDREPALA